MKLVVGLGNPGEEYENTRHNTGFLMLDFLLGNKVDWKPANGTKLLYYKDSIGGKSTEYIKPTTFMNNSGVAVSFVKEKHKLNLKDIVVIYDDVDLPLGSMKISYDRSSGGHNGLESIIKKLKSREFVRVRVGIAPSTPAGKLRKPKGEEAMLKFLLGKYKDDEIKELKKLSKKINEALLVIFTESKEKAMTLFN
jgi:PTH1 family peptidyl-tRNA hydrolase